MVLHGDYLGVVSINTKYQNLQSWFILYEFDRATGNLTLTYKFVINSVCEEFDFMTTPSSSGQMNVTVAIVCNKDIATKSLKYYFFDTADKEKLPKVVLESDIDAVWQIKILNVKHRSNETQMMVYSEEYSKKMTLRNHTFTKQTEPALNFTSSETFDNTVVAGFIFEVDDFDQLLYIYLNDNGSILYTTFDQKIPFNISQKHLVKFPEDHLNQNISEFECVQGQSRAIKCFVYFKRNVPTTFEVNYTIDRSDMIPWLDLTVPKESIVDQYMLPDTANMLDLTLTEEFLIVDTLHINPGILS